jgi:5-methyltetrahydropteroyltriglutamate--homocysteine methyltransferase
MFETTIAAAAQTVLARRAAQAVATVEAGGEALAEGKRDATLLWLKSQEDAGIDTVSDGEQSRQHFVHGFLEAVEGIDFEHKVKMGIRNNRYDAMVPTVVAPLRLRGRVHEPEAHVARAHTTRKLKFTLPGPMTIVDTIADTLRRQGEDGDGVRGAAQSGGACARSAGRRCDPVRRTAFNVYMDDVKRWGIDALHRAIEGLKCETAVHICYGYGIQANIDRKRSLGSGGASTRRSFRRWRKSRLDQVSVECISARVPMSLLKLLAGKDVLLGGDRRGDGQGRDSGGRGPRHRRERRSTCRRSASIPAPTAAWRRWTAISQRRSSRRSALAQRWRAAAWASPDIRAGCIPTSRCTRAPLE